MRDNPWMKKPAYRSVWLELLLEASHEPRDIVWKGKRTTLQPGQLTCGAKQLSEWTGVPRGTVERILKVLKSEEQIEVQGGSKFSLITVKNWTSYQKSEEQNEEQVRNRRGAGEELVRTPKECKNVKMKENTLSKDSKPKAYGNEDINNMLIALKGRIGIDAFADSKKWERIYAKHCYTLLERIGSKEFSRRLDIILDDSFKHKNCNKIRYVYEQVKGFIEPTQSIKSF